MKTSPLAGLPIGWKERGRILLAKVRHGAAAAVWDADGVVAPMPLALGDGAAAEEPPRDDADGGAAGGPIGIERERLQQLQEDDPDFIDVVIALRCLKEAELTIRDGATSDVLYHAVKRALVGKGAIPRQAAKRGERPLLSMGEYQHDDLLYRRGWQEASGEWAPRVVIPKRSFAELPLQRTALPDDVQAAPLALPPRLRDVWRAC